ncbi:hypothetical protein [Pseudooceanicola sp.]|uniref:hypothetical protein n=1 Tax=Pseudooceanicola sp. TaxID=1914328 RepID=UPI0026154DEC|nr:hypothetical protein [Pseudooceanicola sp.]MDF1854786.1 hypothetical protein [Pseudooceanicola sp.]
MERRRFRWKPALLRQAWEVEVDATGITKLGTKGWRIAFADVTRLAFTRETLRGTLFRRLQIHAGGRRYQLGINTGTLGYRSDPDAQAHFAMIRAIAAGLASAVPEVPVDLGRQGGARWAMFLVGLLGVLASVGFVAAAASLRRGGLSVEAGLPILLLSLIGGLYAWSNRPWTQPPRIVAADFPARLDILAQTGPGSETDLPD